MAELAGTRTALCKVRISWERGVRYQLDQHHCTKAGLWKVMYQFFRSCIKFVGAVAVRTSEWLSVTKHRRGHARPYRMWSVNEMGLKQGRGLASNITEFDSKLSSNFTPYEPNPCCNKPYEPIPCSITVSSRVWTSLEAAPGPSSSLWTVVLEILFV